MVKNYIPKKGDILWLYFGSTEGHEQKGKRPAVVISKTKFNTQTGQVFCLPISSRKLKYGTDLAFTGKRISGTILCHHIRSFDWKARQLAFVEPIPSEILKRIGAIISAIIS